MKSLKSSKGFTLVEIMIVVAIIGILLAIAVPGFVKARTQSRQKSCMENLSKIDGAKEQWALETNQLKTASPTEAQLVGVDLFIKTAPICPEDSAKAMASSYTMGTVAETPLCKINPTDHKL